MKFSESSSKLNSENEEDSFLDKIKIEKKLKKKKIAIFKKKGEPSTSIGRLMKKIKKSTKKIQNSI